MSNEDQTNTADEAVDLTPLDVHGMAQLIAYWHRECIEQAKHFLTVPEGQELGAEINGEEIGPVIMTGDARKAFMIGVVAVMSSFAELPFATVNNDDLLRPEDAPVN